MAENRKLNILIVDDEKDAIDINKTMFNRQGHQVYTAETGEQAIEVYKEHKDDIDVIILDIEMPGMGGNESLKQLIEFDPEVVVIIDSGYNPGGPIKEALKAGAKGYVSKPYGYDDLINKINDVMYINSNNNKGE